MRWCLALVSVVLAAGRPDGGSFPLEIHWLGGADGGSLPDPEVIRAVVRSHHGDLKRCYDQALPTHPGLAGKTSIQWMVGEKGQVVSVERLYSTHGASTLDACIVELIRSWRFPEPRGGGIAVVTYPFAFISWLTPTLDGGSSEPAPPGTPDAGP